MFALDTNTLIYYAAGQSATEAFFEEHQNSIFYLPSIVVAEFLSYPLITDSSATAFKRFARQTIVVNLDFAIAELAANLRRRYKVKLMDAVVAATALTAQATLVTNNTRDFKKISGLNLLHL